jgi:hypothetical protein
MSVSRIVAGILLANSDDVDQCEGQSITASLTPSGYHRIGSFLTDIAEPT